MAGLPVVDEVIQGWTDGRSLAALQVASLRGRSPPPHSKRGKFDASAS
jgi:hypothetical protein